MQNGLFILSFILLLALPASAHPVAYQGATGIMTWNQPFMTDSWLTYSFRPDMAVAGRFMRMEMPEGRLNYSGLQFDYLAKRWNGDDHQANIYVYGGAGNVNFKDSNGGAYFGGIEADAEDRKYFSLIKAESMQMNVAKDFNHIEARLGIAPYEAEYGEMATWFMVQAQWHPTLQEKFAVTPLARIFYKSFLLESGVSLDGDWMMNFMFTFNREILYETWESRIHFRFFNDAGFRSSEIHRRSSEGYGLCVLRTRDRKEVQSSS